jgi:7,8-dihydropterin-6-yl-methyl-4-(beta-D-ribofuranosyl)aminobenzene 5'-phosphate synthase
MGIEIDKIDKLVLSHGHSDHTGGLKSFLKARTVKTPIPIIAHPKALEHKSVKMLFFHIPIGFPRLSTKLRDKLEFYLTEKSVAVVPKLFTTGEIPLNERTEKPGIVTKAFHKVDGKRDQDPIIDDLSLVLQTKDGLVVVAGCCHAGLLNACARATRLFNDKIKAIFGGTHMLEYSQKDIDHLGDVLANLYDTPQLYLNHCTGEDAIRQLKNRFGPEIVHDCRVGTEVVFQS